MSEPGAVRLGGGPVRAVLFDYGDTLVTFSRPEAALERAYTAVEALLGERCRGTGVPSAARLVAAVHDAVDRAVAHHDRGGSLEEIALTPVYAAALAALGVVVDATLLEDIQVIEQRAWLEGVTVAPGTVATLRTLRARGLRLGIVSNAPYLPAAMHAQVDHLGLGRLVDAVTFSAEVGWRKPSPRLFAHALAGLGADAATTVVVGDRLREDVDGAHGAGMRAIRLRAHRDDAATPERADAVIDSIADLVDGHPAPGAAGRDAGAPVYSR